MRKVNLSTATDYYPNDGATGFTLASGWNWVGIRVEIIWGYTHVKFYHSEESLSTGDRQNKIEFVWEGTYD